MSPAPHPLPAFYDDLDLTLDTAWSLLSRAVADRRHGFHTPMVATVAADGAPALRTVVLRAAERSASRLRFHTDRRSAKWAEIARDPRIGLGFYDAGAKIQLRITGLATLHTDDAFADAAWAASRSASRVCYGTAPAPGTGIGASGDFTLPDDDDDIAAGRVNFCAVEVAVTRLEWLYLAFQGHRRALFEAAGEGWAGRWLAP